MVNIKYINKAHSLCTCSFHTTMQTKEWKYFHTINWTIIWSLTSGPPLSNTKNIDGIVNGLLENHPFCLGLCNGTGFNTQQNKIALQQWQKLVSGFQNIHSQSRSTIIIEDISQGTDLFFYFLIWIHLMARVLGTIL